MRIACATAAFVPHGGLDACVKGALAQHWPDRLGRLPPPSFLIVANGGGILDAADWWARQGVAVWRPGRNIGASAAWNRACRWAFTTGHDAVLLLGDDIELTDQGTLGLFAEAYLAGGFRQMRFAADRGFSAVALTRDVWEEVGPFDEGFWPAYFEDNDYWRRFTLRGIPWEHVPAPTLHGGSPGHARGSSTIRTDSEMNSLNGQTFSLNRDRFAAKWGGQPHHETYAEPWNGGPERPSTRDLLLPVIRDRVERPYGPEEVWPW